MKGQYGPVLGNLVLAMPGMHMWQIPGSQWMWKFHTDSYLFLRFMRCASLMTTMPLYSVGSAVWYAQLEIDVDLSIAFNRFHMASYSDPWQRYPMPSTVKECGRSFLCTSLRMNLQLDSGYSRYIQARGSKLFGQTKSLGKSKKVPATTSTCAPHSRKDHWGRHA